MEFIFRLIKTRRFGLGFIGGFVMLYGFSDVLSPWTERFFSFPLPTITQTVNAEQPRDHKTILARRAIGQQSVGIVYAGIEFGTKGFETYDGIISAGDIDSILILIEQMRRLSLTRIHGQTINEREVEVDRLMRRMQRLLAKARQVGIGLDLAIINQKGDFYQVDHQRKQADRDFLGALSGDNEGMIVSSRIFGERFGEQAEALRLSLRTLGQTRESLLAQSDRLQNQYTMMLKNTRSFIQDPTLYNEAIQ
ncbi:MAG: hypothetical protein NZL83_01935 [Candidatus Absconditabacterales bacterium]|nr:hypothetical protein [Candidatus Absconditabacterales bacterium]